MKKNRSEVMTRCVKCHGIMPLKNAMKTGGLCEECNAPPPLGISVSEKVATKDKMG